MKKRSSQMMALLVGALLSVFAWGAAAHAQGVTTSAVGGRVTNEQGQAVTDARITVTNIATGSVSSTGTRSDGRYFIPGLQPGNYRVRITRLGFGVQTRDNVTLSLGQTATFDFSLRPEAVALEGITVSAESNPVISRDRTGTATTLSDSTLRRTPTITRDLQDFTRLVPQLAVTNSSTGAVSGGGRNNRFNQLQIDGTASNDLFGLSASGNPSGQAGAKAITLEAIQELQVVLAPFDVRQNGFTGASVNAITRSGTNRFKGSLSGFNRNENLVGTLRRDGETAPDIDTFNNTELAGSFGGPILRDRAFFFIAGETSERVNPVNVVAGSDPANGITAAQAEQLRSYLQTLGYDPGSVGARDIDRQSVNLFGRLDFNLGQNNRLTLRHNYVDGERENFSRGTRAYTLGNAGYTQNSTTNSSVLQLNSSFGSGIFNELRLGYNRVRDFRAFEGGTFPRIRVDFGNGDVIAGTENFSGRNVLDQDAFEITNDLTIPWGAHSFTIGTSNDFAQFSNLFVRNAFGNYEFDSFDALRAGVASRYEYSYLCRTDRPNCTVNGNERAEFSVNRYSLYAQDRWEARDNLQLTLGVRADVMGLPDSPGENPVVQAQYGRSTAARPDNSVLFNPRVGFNWDVTNDGVTQVRGGVGVFSGRTPYVWISNAYGNTGLDYVRFTCTGTQTPAFVSDPNAQPLGCARTTNPAPNEINLIDTDFKAPQIARYSLAVDRQLPMGLVGTLEGLYTQTLHDVLYQNLRVQRDSLGRMVEGRPRYQTRSNTPGLGDVIDITNTDEGLAYNLTTQIQRPFRNGWDFSLAYTYSHAEDVNPLTSSQAISNWRFNLTDDNPNNPGLNRSDNDIPHRIVGQTSVQLKLLRSAATDLSLVYVGQSGAPFSFRYNSDINFDGSFGNDLFYVPANASEVRFRQETINGAVVAPEQSYQNLNDLIERVECLRESRGEVLERNSCRAPWSNRFDFRLAQNVSPGRRHNLQLTMDVLNVGNLLNPEWGRSEFVSNNTISLLTLATGRGVNNDPDAEGRRLYRAFAPRRDVFLTSDLESRYQIQLGVRYNF